MNLHQMILATEQEVWNEFKRMAISRNREYFESKEPMHFLFIKGDMDVCLVAHIDTVRSSHGIYLKENNRMITAWSKQHDTQQILGADDRAGCWIIYDLMKYQFQGAKRPHILITNYEECGGRGAREFAQSNLTQMHLIKWFVEYDRRGSNTYVTYNKNPEAMHQYLAKFGLEYDRGGSYSDIATITASTLVPSCNIGTGYYYQHTANEFLCIESMNLAINKSIRFINQFPADGFGFLDPPQPVRTESYSRVVEDDGPTEYRPYDWCGDCMNYMIDCDCVCEECGISGKPNCICGEKDNSHEQKSFNQKGFKHANRTRGISQKQKGREDRGYPWYDLRR